MFLFRDQDFYRKEIYSRNLKGKHVKIIGIDVWDRVDLFSYYLMKDVVYYIVAMLLILVIAGFYTQSFILIIFTMLNVLFSFGLAYFMYFIVFQIPHMPFMSLLSFLLLIAIGVDDVFIFCDAFDHAKGEHHYIAFDEYYNEPIGRSFDNCEIPFVTS